jgi:hypothetical protein
MKDYIINRLKNNVGKKYVGTLQKQNDLMQADFEQNLKEMSIDFKVSMKTKVNIVFFPFPFSVLYSFPLSYSSSFHEWIPQDDVYIIH